MTNYRTIWVNDMVINKGETLTICKQSINNYHTMRKAFLWEVKTGKHKGSKFWSSDLNHFREYKINVPKYMLICLTEYVKAGYSEERLIYCGLVPSECKPYLKQFIKYIDKLEGAENLNY